MYDPYFIYLIGFSTIAVFGTSVFFPACLGAALGRRTFGGWEHKRWLFTAAFMGLVATSGWMALFDVGSPMAFGFDRIDVLNALVGVTVGLCAFGVLIGVATLLSRLIFRTSKPQARTEVWQNGTWRHYDPSLHSI
ncbi:MAG: hypothetical protein HY340_02120 [Candidatus Kerfeldbacteria bacterium]|nr:hypothetical protein [Candidatus Kerfeldbacteria bacterium]